MMFARGKGQDDRVKSFKEAVFTNKQLTRRANTNIRAATTSRKLCHTTTLPQHRSFKETKGSANSCREHSQKSAKKGEECDELVRRRRKVMVHCQWDEC